MKKLVLEVNQQELNGNDTFKAGECLIMTTPELNEDYWKFRVRVHKNQSIIGFPKFGLIGIGFAKETDWNTNLPSGCETENIYNHIRCNKGYKSISRETCIRAIKMIQDAAKLK